MSLPMTPLEQESATGSQSSWEAEVLRRAGGFLEVSRLESLLIIVPGVSGDVALSTTLIREVKRLNPRCRIHFGTNRETVGVARLCPGVEDILVLPPVKRHLYSRGGLLRQYAGCADRVVYASCVREDVDLLARYSPVEALWLLAGMRHMPEERMRLWLEPPADGRPVDDILRDSAGEGLTPSRLSRRAAATVRSLLRCGRRMMLDRTHLPAALAAARKALGQWKSRPARSAPGCPANGPMVILGTGARSLQGPGGHLIEAMVDVLRRAGYTVLHNVLEPSEAATGTVPLTCSHGDFLRLRQEGIPFVGWRSGLCDIAAAADAPMCVMYPAEGAYVRRPIELFGFESMRIEAKCLEFVCDEPSDIRNSGLPDFLSERRRYA